MKKLNNELPLLLFLIFVTVTILTSACNPLKPIAKTDTLQALSENDLRKFNGDYDIFSVDSSFRTSAFALTYSKKFNSGDSTNANDRINLLSIDSRHLKVTVFKSDKVVKTKIIRGHLSQNYFRFKLTRLSTVRPFYFILNFYSVQKNRIGLLKNGDLTLDTNGGGVLLLIIMPTFGSGAELYNLVFKRKANSS